MLSLILSLSLLLLSCEGDIEASSRNFNYLPRFSLEDLRKPENEQFARGGLPFVLTGVIENWPASEKWKDLEYLSKKLPEEIVDWYPNNLMNADDHPSLTAFHNGITQMKAELTKPQYLQLRLTLKAKDALYEDIDASEENFPPLIQWDWWLGKKGCLMSKEAQDNFFRTTQWNMLVIGNKGAGMFIHPDGLNTGTWQAQIVGRKMWFLCSPDQAHFLYGPGKIDAFHADLEKYPLFEEAYCLTDVITAGELVYYPSNWWHQTLNLDFPCIGLAGRAVTRYNYHSVRNTLNDKCNSGAPDISLKYKGASPNPNPEVCSSISVCHDIWEARFGYL